MKGKTLSEAWKWNLFSIPILFIIGSIFHFLYDLSGKSAIVGAVAAVNESVWEHQKMVLLPVIGWWAIYYLLKGRNDQLDRRKWFSGLTVSLCVSILTIPFAYYFYSQAFGIHLIIVDASILLVAFAAGQLAGFHFYKYSKGIPFYVSIMIVMLIFLVFVVFTFDPPQIPWFRDGLTGQYGID